MGTPAILGGYRYLVPFNGGIATTSVRTGLAMTALLFKYQFPDLLSQADKHFGKLLCSQGFFHDKIECRWYDKATKRKRSKKANGHEEKSRTIPICFLLSIPSDCVFPQIRRLGPTVRIPGRLPGEAGSIPAGVANKTDMVLSSSRSGPRAFNPRTWVRIPQASPYGALV